MTATMCPKDDIWPSTIANTVYALPCFSEVPDGLLVTRFCTENGTWADEDSSSCSNGILLIITSALYQFLLAVLLGSCSYNYIGSIG